MSYAPIFGHVGGTRKASTTRLELPRKRKNVPSRKSVQPKKPKNARGRAPLHYSESESSHSELETDTADLNTDLGPIVAKSIPEVTVHGRTYYKLLRCRNGQEKEKADITYLGR